MAFKAKHGVIALVLAMAAVGGYWYYSPYLAVKAMQSAAQRQDADAFNEHVDYPHLRESLKGQMSALMAKSLGESRADGMQTFGAMLGLALVNQMVEAFVRPEVVMRAIQEGRLQPKPKPKPEPMGTPGTESDTPSEVKWGLERRGTSKVIAYPYKANEPDASRTTGMVFERYGFADWKLTEIRLPQQSR